MASDSPGETWPSKQHLQDRVVDAVSKHPALDANLGTGSSRPRRLGCRHNQRSYIMYEICLGAAYRVIPKVAADENRARKAPP